MTILKQCEVCKRYLLLVEGLVRYAGYSEPYVAQRHTRVVDKCVACEKKEKQDGAT